MSRRALHALRCARQIADTVGVHAIENINRAQRPVSEHLGAILADSVLQAGVNYRTVVRPRVERIVTHFPEAADLAGTMEVVGAGKVHDFLMWSHSEKIGRFIRLAELLDRRAIRTVTDVRSWFGHDSCRKELLRLSGIGPKTVDYMNCLVGADCIAVDRHVKAFVASLGIESDDYTFVQLTVSYAADLLNVGRRDFDSWIWRVMSAEVKEPYQYVLFEHR